MSRIFISYSRKDQDFARQLASDLSNAGLDVWIDVDDIPAGMKWHKAIEQGLETCNVMLLIVSPESMASDNVEDEWNYFHSRKKPIIPIWLRDAKMPFQLERYQYVNFKSQSFDVAFRELTTELTRYISMPQLPSPEVVASANQNRNYVPIAAGVAVVATIIIVGILVSMRGDENPSSDNDIATEVVQQNNSSLLTPAITEQTPTQVLERQVEDNDDWTMVEQIFEDDIPMVLVPIGCFDMGDSPAAPDERDGNEVCLNAYWIDKTEVTQADFVRLGGKQEQSNAFIGDNRPVDRITWYEAQAFCEVRGGSLPTEAQWAYAARGVDNLVFPWGMVFDASLLVHSGNSDGQTADVGLYPDGATWTGALDMSGNVSEWTLSAFTVYPYAEDDGRNDNFEDTNIQRAIRGGSYLGTGSTSFRLGNRNGANPHTVDSRGRSGFRCVKMFEA